MNHGFEYREQLGPRTAGKSALTYLAERYRHSTDAEWRERLARGEVTVEGATAGAETLLQPGQWLSWQRPPWHEPDVPLAFAVLFEDRDLLAVAKPSGLPTMPAGGFLEHTLFAIVRARNPDATPAHRLGRGTSGLVLFALSTAARRQLAASWRGNAVTKAYRALASGHPQDDSFSIDTRIGPVPHPLLGQVEAASANGRDALSHVRVCERRETDTLVDVVIETGRPHQIRIHLASAGHPLVGDPLYAAGGGLLPSGDALPGDGGYLLHAHRLTLPHPVTGAPLELECQPPPALRTRRDG